MRKSQRREVLLVKQLIDRPKWWNQAFAKYDQKRLHAWASEWQTQALKPLRPRLSPDVVPGELSHLSDRMLYRELYQPYVARNLTGVTS